MFKRMEIIKFIGLYIKSRIKIIIFFAVTYGIFASVIALYNLPLSAVIYASQLGIFAAAIFSLFDFVNVYKKHIQLKKVSNCTYEDIEKLPQSKNIIESDYRNIVEKMYIEHSRNEYEFNKKSEEMMDYYTLWAHQIKTPIAAMRLLIQSYDNEEKNSMSGELFKIEQYVEMVLQYLRLDTMSSDMVLRHYSLDEIVKKAVRKYARTFVIKKIRLDFSELSCDVLTDEKWLIFVVEQVLSNALKYTRENGCIKIYMDKGRDRVLVIEDNGIGIKSEDIARVFDRGFTGYNGRAYKKSTGIGLYLCRKIMDKLSHNIYIESEVDKGTKVFIDLNTDNLEVE